MLKIKTDMMREGSHATRLAALAAGADAVSELHDGPLPKPLIRIHFRLLVSNLEQHGITDVDVACAFAERYIAAFDTMATPKFETRWQQILQSGHMRQEARIKAMDKVLRRAEARQTSV